MRLNKKHHLRAGFDPAPPKAILPIPVQTTFRHMRSSPAVAARVEAEADKLRRYYSGIHHCHVVISAPHRRQQVGHIYSVHLELGVPREHLAITHEHASHTQAKRNAGVSRRPKTSGAHEDIYVVLREVFDAARRRLEDYARRQRGDVKRHASVELP
jgi:ribosome-associated translation inhibitor RaiA